MPEAAIALDPIVQYLIILHEHGLGSRQARVFKRAHKDDPTLWRRMRGADRFIEAGKLVNLMFGFTG